MKILYFHQHFSTPAGSTSIRSYKMAKALVDAGHEVVMVCGRYAGGDSGISGPFIRGARRGLVEGINLVEYNLSYSNSDNFLKRTFIFLMYSIRSTGLAFTEAYDVLFATSTPLTAGIPGVMSRWVLGKRFVFEVRDLWPALPKAMKVIQNPLVVWALNVLEWVIYHSANRLVALSPGIVDGIAIRGVDRARIAMVPNGCDLEIFSNSGIAWRPSEVAPGDLMAVFAGTHGIANGLNAVLDVALELKLRQREDIKLVLIGRGKLKSELQLHAQSLGLDNVVFHEPVDKQKLAGLMASTDLGMQILTNVPAFYSGTSPNKFFDYISAGVPVLNNYPGWLADIITESGCGYTIPPDNPIAFADALESAADNRGKLKDMGQRARKLAEEKFSRSCLSNKWVAWVTAS